MIKFLVDAQLPFRLATFLNQSGYDTIHTQNLPFKNATPDTDINELSIQEQRIVITKDVDFLNSFMTIQKPYKLILVTTGNIKNSELEQIFAQNLNKLINILNNSYYVEINRNEIIVHQ